MLFGEFVGDTGRPYIDGYVVIPQFRCYSEISFLMDTGADNTMLLPKGVSRVGLSYHQLTSKSQGLGIGGLASTFLEPALLAFFNDDTIYGYEIELSILESNDDHGRIEALLGRDIINRWDINYNRPSSVLQADVIFADLTIPI